MALLGAAVLSQAPWEVEFSTGGRPQVKGAGGPRPRPVSSFRTEWPGAAWRGLGTRPWLTHRAASQWVARPFFH